MLPTYEQAADECRNSEKPSALSWFITEQEPSGIVEEAKFRRELEAVIKETEIAAALRQQAFCERKYAKEKNDLIAEIGLMNKSLSESDLWLSDRFVALLCFVSIATGVVAIYILSRMFPDLF